MCPYGLQVYGRQWRHERRGEYLLDQVWRQEYETDHDERLRLPGAVVFGMECEWTQGVRDQFYDFQKLLDVRCKLALFVSTISSFSDGYGAAKLFSVLAKLHSGFSGELVIYHLDRKSPVDRFKAWAVRRPAPGAEFSVHPLTEFVQGEA
jgi:hypothetical protein